MKKKCFGVGVGVIKENFSGVKVGVILVSKIEGVGVLITYTSTPHPIEYEQVC